MGLSIICENCEDSESKVELWQSSYSTFSRLRNIIRHSIMDSRKIPNPELAKLELAQEKYPELRSLIAWFIKDTTRVPEFVDPQTFEQVLEEIRKSDPDYHSSLIVFLNC